MSLLDRDPFRELINNTIQEQLDYMIDNKLWRTKTGEFLDIREMSSDHLLNTIQLLTKNRGFLRRSDNKFVVMMNEELYNRL